MGHLYRLLFLNITFFTASISLNAQDQYYQNALQLVARQTEAAEQAELPLAEVAELAISLETLSQSGHEAFLFINELNIRAQQTANCYSFSLYVDPSLPDLQELRNSNNLQRGPLRLLLDTYELSIKSWTEEEGLLQLNLESPRPKNIAYIARKFSEQKNVFLVEIPSLGQKGPDIYSKKIYGGWLISYVYPYYDEQGQENTVEWQFGCNGHGEWSYLGQYGALPKNFEQEAQIIAPNNN
ncbi:hypothetical protein SapgrDRAFT_1367 [Saprospira grandis DSM 2844]|uniref:Uncharacterized protein n=1 Tax=Saprospira grandis DSM 2844 TaxID=694433 RepID=J1I424_9BACT|nr:hypothetical protein [Saprospira grandis]EJF53083.1 hypothetical protein SapgrDRAFT_1367 [Saprospira grandis DSM 2844]